MAIIDRRGLIVDEAATTSTTTATSAMAIKAPCRAATTSAITLSGEQTIDGIAVVENNRVLVKNQSDAAENGIYIVSSGNWSRATDADAANELINGTLCFVISGDANAQNFFQLSCTDPITIDVSELTWTSINALNAETSRVETATGDVTIPDNEPNDVVWINNTSGGPITVYWPSGSRGGNLEVKDYGLNAGTHNITLSRKASTSETLMGGTTFVLDVNGMGLKLKARPDGNGWG